MLAGIVLSFWAFMSTISCNDLAFTCPSRMPVQITPCLWVASLVGKIPQFWYLKLLVRMVVSRISAVAFSVHFLSLRLANSHCFVICVLWRAYLLLRVVRILLLDTTNAFLCAQRLVTRGRRRGRLIRAANSLVLDIMTFTFTCIVCDICQVWPLHRNPSMRHSVSRCSCHVCELHKLFSTDVLALVI